MWNKHFLVLTLKYHHEGEEESNLWLNQYEYKLKVNLFHIMWEGSKKEFFCAWEFCLFFIRNDFPVCLHADGVLLEILLPGFGSFFLS